MLDVGIYVEESLRCISPNFIVSIKKSDFSWTLWNIFKRDQIWILINLFCYIWNIWAPAGCDVPEICNVRVAGSIRVTGILHLHKSCIRETLNLLSDADRSKGTFLCHWSALEVPWKCHGNAVEVALKWRWSAIEVPLKCKQPTANGQSHRPSPCNSPTIHSRLV